MKTNQVVTRFAPSPTGFMHVGGVRTALYAWLFARKNGGKFILRIEDTDKEREVQGSIEHIMKSLKWLGIEWNEGPDIGGPNAPYIQSERKASHQKYAQQLIDKGLAYADPYTEEEVEGFRKQAEEAKKPFLYRDYRPENPPVWDGSQPLRLKIVDPKESHWHDLVRGDLSAGPEALDDFVIIKSDGYPTYNFAHIIDDLEMGVTHIMRSDEFISSTPKYLALYEALGIERPEFVMLPPIMGADGKKKLGKRDGAKDAMDYQREGYLPQALMNFLAFIGWNPGGEKEVFTPQELIEEFSIERIHTSGGKFNEEKLKWFNKEHLKLMLEDAQKEYIRPAVVGLNVTQDAGRIERSLLSTLERISYSGEVAGLLENGELNYLRDEIVLDPALIAWKQSTQQDAYNHLGVVLDKLAGVPSITQAFTDDLLAYATEHGKGNVLWPLRYVLSGSQKSPDPFTLLTILEKEEAVKRIEAGRTQLAGIL
ncbi:MAG TPA: glutamate--tRNA ligase [Candidatus Paceibacterota bacterium]